MPSGLGRAAFEIASALRDAGRDVTLIDASRPFGDVTRIEDVGVVGAAPPSAGPWHRLRGVAGAGHLVAPLFFRRALAAEHARRPFDVAEATNWYAPAAFVRGLPLVVRNSTPAIDAFSDAMSLRDRADLRFAHRLEARTARRADALISNTGSHAALIERLYDLPPSAEHAVVSLALAPETLRAGRAAGRPPEGPPRLLFVGRAERRKGFAETLTAHAALVQRWRADGREPPALDLVGVDVGQVDRADGVVVHEKVDDDVLYALYAGATLVLAPSRYESFGLVYREAAAFGRPLVACAEDPAASEFVTETGCGVLAERCDAASIAAATVRVLDDPDLRERCGKNGLEAAARLSREALARETLTVYRRAAARHLGRYGRNGRSRAAMSA